MRLSGRFWPTLRDAPADAEAVSHKLMVRAGLIRQLASGLYSFLPFGLRSLQRVTAIIREEMDRIGAQELQLPIMQPAEIWEATGRYGLDEQFRLEDRGGRAMVLGMTHEEIITWHAAREIRSYRDLPQSWYQFQTKLRDEPRPKSGILRVREFTMKDSYSMDTDEDGLARSYDAHAAAYARIFDRCGIVWYMVESDVGMMGGMGAHEFMAPSPAGEDTIARSPSGAYAANIELATSIAVEPEFGPIPDTLQAFDTPGIGTIEQLSAFTGLAPVRLCKSVVVVSDDGPVMALIRGEHTLHEKKLSHIIGRHRPAQPDEIRGWFGASPGSLGPVGVEGVRIVADTTIATGHYVTGANRDGEHLRGVVLGRDFVAEVADIRNVLPGEGCPVSGEPLDLEPVIEIGNIFKLGTRYSEPLGAGYLDESGAELPVWMASYGIGPARIVAAAVEQFADEKGISWPAALAPFAVHLVALGKPGTPERDAAEALYETLVQGGVETIFDDRDLGPGEKFAEAELLGCPLRLTVGRRSLESGEIEVQIRRGREQAAGLPLGGEPEALLRAVDELWRGLP